MAVVVGALVLVGAGGWGVARVVHHPAVAPPVTEACTASADGIDWPLSPDRAAFAALIGARALVDGMPARAATIAIATAYQESTILNLRHGDRDSLGLFQQRPSQGWGSVADVTDPVRSTDAFYAALARVPGYRSMTITQAAQAVQRSGFPEAYAEHEGLGRSWASALTGYSTANLTCTLRPVRLAGDGTVDDGLDTTDRGARAAEPLTAFVQRLSRDLPHVPVTREPAPAAAAADASTTGTGPSAVVRARRAAKALGLGTDEASLDRTAWALGQWAVAVASQTGAVAVEVATHAGTQRWDREHAAWRTVADGPAGPPGIRVELSAR